MGPSLPAIQSAGTCVEGLVKLRLKQQSRFRVAAYSGRNQSGATQHDRLMIIAGILRA